MMKWLYLAITFILNAAGVYAYRYYALRKNFFDHPNDRSLHTRPTPFGGGVIFSVFFITVIFINVLFYNFPLRYALVFIPGSFVLTLIGFLDDKLNVRVRIRFVMYILISIYTIMMLGYGTEADLGFLQLSVGWLGYGFVTLVMLWSINLFNFMDGLDGLASLEAIFILIFGGFFCWYAEGYVLAWLAWLLAASVAGFVYWNLPPARIFMGDTGSVFLGFIIPVFAFAGEKWVGVPALLWFMLYTIFYIDTTVTLVRRIFAGHQWYRPHSFHSYKRMYDAGWSHRNVLCAYMAVNVGLAIITSVAYFYQQYMFELWLLCLAYVGFFYYLVERKYPMFGTAAA